MKAHRIVLGVAFTAIVISCSAGGGSTFGNGGSGSSHLMGGNGPLGTGGGLTGLITSNTNTPPDDSRDAAVRQKVCDDAGNCVCLRLALIGTLDSAANSKNTQAFTDWLNNNSAGTAAVTMYATKPTLDDAFLSGYDVLIVANVNGWTFSDAEKQAVQNWVSGDKAGGIITLTGFTSKPNEPADTSQLISFAGLSYTSTETATEAGQQLPVYYQGTQIQKYCIAWTGPGESDAIITTPIPFNAETGELGKLTYELNYVGAFHGWGVNAPSSATIVATDPVSKQTMAAAVQVGDKGRIYAYGDEWVTFTNTWVSTGNPPNTQADPYNACYHMANDAGPSDPANFFYTIQNVYQTKQFWFDAINWVAPPSECSFTIKDPDVVPPPL